MDPAAADAPPRVLVVDDDHDIRELLAAYLQRQGMDVATAADGAAMWRQLDAQPRDLVVLDLNLPGDDGLALTRQLRARRLDVAIIMLTARAEPVDRIVGLELGADDYVPKPFEPRELAARIRTVLRRWHGTAAGARDDGASASRRGWQFAGWRLDVGARALHAPDGTQVTLTSGEFRLLRTLVEHAGRVLSRDALLAATQGREAGPFDRSIDLHVSRLRQKLGDDGKQPTLLKTVRNEGYVLAVDARRLA